MTRQKKYDHEEIIRMYEAKEKICVIAAVLGCHQTTISKVINSAKVQPRRVKREYSMIEIVQQSAGMTSSRLAKLMGTTTAYVNKLRYQARKKSAKESVIDV